MFSLLRKGFAVFLCPPLKSVSHVKHIKSHFHHSDYFSPPKSKTSSPMRSILLLIIPALILTSCGPKHSSMAPTEQLNPEGVHEVLVAEVIQGSTYTYVRVTEQGNEYWIATAKSDIKQGGKYYYSNGTEMLQFHSKELDRTFESIIFADALGSEASASSPMDAMPGGHGMMGGNTNGAPDMGKSEISVEPVSGGTSIAQIYQNKSKLSGKQVKVSGQVVKVNNGIMGTNWVHIQDGTEFEKQFDLTITTQESYNVGDKVVFEGKITLDKDFGYGYKYPVIMEEGSGKPSKQL